jgi:hypothetical protein
MTTWGKLIEEAMKKRGETLADIESITLSPEETDVPFDNGYGSTEGRPFTAWTAKTVYFPVCYDGVEWVGSVSRHPDGKPTDHQGY